MASNTAIFAKKNDLRTFARNVALDLNDQSRRSISLAICFDALTSTLDKFMQTKEWKLNGEPKLFSDYLKEELEKRKEAAKPETKPEENANPPSDGK